MTTAAVAAKPRAATRVKRILAFDMVPNIAGLLDGYGVGAVRDPGSYDVKPPGRIVTSETP
ncbi:hypothetical protein GCM10010403_45940 [Glycomyces rutgersensis]|uniref:Uncharacterized protein n=1 Tax=Glycomyces rutgersensis TaxID=58115 RepID=A0ABN3G9P1_9ACTN